MKTRASGSYVGLTFMQAELLSFIRKRERLTGTPSFEEMRDHLDLASKSGVHRLITALEARGYIERRYHSARSIRTFDTPKQIAREIDNINLSEVPVSALLSELRRRVPDAKSLL